MILIRRGEVSRIDGRRPGVTEITVRIGEREEKAISYDLLTGKVEVGDRVVLNTTAVAKGLGTGGFHFVMCVEGKKVPDPAPEGHIMKMRYTPLQVKVLAVEEDEHPGSAAYRSAENLGGMPVVVATLHSMLAPVAAAFKHTAGRAARVAYLMTDGAALPIWISRLVQELRDKSLIDLTVTCGQAFGGDYEAINVYSGLIWAKAAGTDLAVVSMGPGIVGSASEFGHTALEQGEIVNAVNILGGTAIAVPRVSFAEGRERHYGLSHHTRTALGKVALTGCTVPVPGWQGEKKSLVERQMRESGILDRHRVVVVNTSKVPEIMAAYGLSTTTMGRSIKEDPDFFLAAGAAGIYAAGLIKPRVDKAPDCRVKTGLGAQDTDQPGYLAGEIDPVSGAV